GELVQPQGRADHAEMARGHATTHFRLLRTAAPAEYVRKSGATTYPALPRVLRPRRKSLVGAPASPICPCRRPDAVAALLRRRIEQTKTQLRQGAGRRHLSGPLDEAAVGAGENGRHLAAVQRRRSAGQCRTGVSWSCVGQLELHRVRRVRPLLRQTNWDATD